MRREDTGKFEEAVAGGVRVRAYLPPRLPPSPPINFEGPLMQAMESATSALGRLDGVAEVFPDRDLMVYFLLRKEAVISSQIEGTQSSLSDFLRYEVQGARGVPIYDVVEVANYIQAFDYGLRRMDELPLCNRLIREMHVHLLATGRGSDKLPGEFRHSQVWLGAVDPRDAEHVPPPHMYVNEYMGDLERFLHSKDDGLPTLARAGIAHVQFETIHPFPDGNGRAGRMLIILTLIQHGMLRYPVLSLSLYFKRHRQRYYELLTHVRRTGDWEAWLQFYFEAVTVAANSAVDTARRLSALFEKDRAKIEALGRSTGSNLNVYKTLTERAIVSASEVARATDLARSTISLALNVLVDLGIAREITGGRRNRLYAYDEYLSILSEGAEPD